MFTGIIRHTGTLHRISDKSIEIRCPGLASKLSQGESVAVNGVCLTATDLQPDSFRADLLDETLRVTTLGSLPDGAMLNLEPALKVGDSLGGHMLSGHVEARGRLAAKVVGKDGDCELTVAIPPELNSYVVQKGSIAIDGVSLTIQKVEGLQVTVHLIPETLRATGLEQLETGNLVNIEPDQFVKNVQLAVERVLKAREARTQRNE